MKLRFDRLAMTGRSFALVLFAFIFSLFSVGVARGQADPDLPGAGATFEMVPAGSLVVAMDTNHQALVGPFNLKAYGLVNALLHTNIPVKWAIAAGKSKDGVDFSGRAQRVFPSGQSAAEYTFRGGPFIVHRDFTNRAASVISAFGNQVAVYRLLEDRQIDVRYTVAHKPQVAVLDDGGTDDIQTEILEEAGFPAAHYRVLHAADVAFLPVSSCFTIVTTPHFDGGTTANNQTRAIRDFVKDGGNFLAQCAAVRTYENNGQFGHFHTTRGIMDDDSAKTFDYPHGDMAFNQFQGPLADEGGNLQDWELQAGSVLTNHAYAQVLKAGTANIYRASVAKLQRGKPGSVVFYLGGHNYDGNDIEHYNGRRMYLNALFVPVDRPAECVINFQTDLAVSVDNGVSVVTNGQAVTYTVVVTNRGPGRVLGARVRDVFPGSLGNVSWTSVASGGATNLNPTGTGNIEAMVNLPIGGSVRFTVRATVTAAASGMITNTAAVEVPATMSDSDLSNNQASDVDRVLQGTVIVVPPVDQTNCPQTTATFSVSATGTGLGYQWFYGNNPLAGQTNATLVLNNVSVAQGGIYSVTVSGAVGGPVTRSATLTINSNVVVVTPPSNQTNCAGTLAMFNVNATGSGLTYQWYRDTNLLLGQTNSSLQLPNVTLNAAGVYRVVVAGSCGSAVTNSAALIVNLPVTVTSIPQNQIGIVGSNVTFRVEATGSELRYQWFFNGIVIGTGRELSLNNLSTNQAGQYCSVVSGVCGSAVTNCVILTINTPTVVIVPPVSQTNCPGSSASFNVTANGTSLGYQWYFGTQPLPGQTRNSLLITNVVAGNAGTYSVVVSGAAGGPVTNTATLTVNSNVLVTLPLVSLTNCVGTTASFNIGATGTSVRYQWYFGDALLTLQTNSTFNIVNVATTNAGQYSVVVSGPCGIPVTNHASLVVNQPLVVTNPPTTQISVVGSNAVFFVGASGTGLTYRWFFNNVLVGTNNTLALGNLTTNQAGEYCSVVSGLCGPAVTNCSLLIISNRPPVSVRDSYTIFEDEILDAFDPGVLDNDSDPDGDRLFATLFSNPQTGSLNFRFDGTFVYTPKPNFFGQDAFTYRATDGAVSGPATAVIITVLPRNDAPLANPDFYTVGEGGTLNPTAAIGVLANDVDPETNGLTAVLVTGPVNGTLTLNPNGSFTYVHNGSETQSDTFTYRANDGVTNSGIALVTITVTAVNDAPVANPDFYTVGEGGTLNPTAAIGVLANDVDPETNGLTAVLVTGPVNGTLTLNPNGSFTYVHNGGETQSDTFTYRANDGVTNSGIALVTITVTAVNDAPVANPDFYTVGEGGTLNPTAAIGVLANDVDPETNGLTAVLVTGPVNGTLTLNPNGSFTYVHNGSETQSDTFTYRANDGVTNSGIALVTITVTAVNDAPVANPDFYTVGEGGTLNPNAAIGVLANDVDPDTNGLTAVLVTGPVNGTLTLNPNGSFTYVHNGSETQSDTFTYRANDGVTNSGIALVTITVTAVNDAPVANPDFYTVGEGGTLNPTAAIGVLANDIDPDTNGLTAVLVTGPVNGTLTLNPNGSFTYVHNGSETQSDTFTYRANDGVANSGIALVTITVTAANDAPRAFPDFYNLNEDQTLTVGVPGVLGNDVDNEGNPLTAVLVTGPGRGSLVLQPDGSFVYVPEIDFHGTDTFRYKARDGSAESEVVTVTLTVGAVNDAPDFNLGPDQLVNPSTGPYALSGFATGIKAGPANEAGQALTFIVSVDRPELFVGVPTLGLDGTLRYTPGPTPGVAVVSVVLMDDGGRANGGVDRSAVKTFRIRINAPPLVSIVSPTNEAVFVASQNVTIVADAMDTDGVVTNVQFYVGTNLLAQRTSAPYFVVWTNVPAGVYELRARATDDLGLTTTSSVVRIRVIEKLPLTFIGPILYDGNVDLFKQQVRVFNPTPFTLEGARVLVFNLNRPGDRVYNANGTNNGTAFVQFNAPIPPGQSANLTLEYYFPSRVVPSPGPTLVTEIVPPSGPIMLEGQGQRINRTVQFPVNQTFLIDFTSILNRSYAVQYSSDLVTWKTVVPTIIGTGANVQWVDNGAPKTESAPAVTEKRFYRVILLP